MNILLLSYGNESSIEIVKSINELNEHTVYGCHWDTINAGSWTGTLTIQNWDGVRNQTGGNDQLIFVLYKLHHID